MRVSNFSPNKRIVVMKLLYLKQREMSNPRSNSHPVSVDHHIVHLTDPIENPSLRSLYLGNSQEGALK
jgi:hypothetical protein